MEELMMAGAMALMLVLQLQAPQQQVSPSQQQAPQQAIPDAPKPQAPALAPNLGPIAPGSGTTPTSNGDTTPSTDLPAGPTNGTSTPLLTNSEPEKDDPNEAPPDQGLPLFNLGPLRANFVEVPFTVKDSKNRLVPALTWRDVRIYENGVRQHISNFTVDPFPLSIALVIDQSLDFHTMERVNNSLGALQGAFTPYDEVAVFTYNNGPKMQTDFTGGQSARLSAVVERSKGAGRDMAYYAGGGLREGINLNNGAQANITPLSQSHGVGSPSGVDQVEREVHTLNDAILEAAKAESHVPKGRRRIIYVISDGKEYGSTAKQKDVIRYLQTNRISVYATLVGDSSVAGMGFIDSIHLPLMMRDNILPIYTKATGGEFYAEYRQKGIETSFAKITEEVRNQYTVGFYSRDPMTDPKFRTTEVKVLRPNLLVIAKKGYYPTPEALPPPAVRASTPPTK